MNLSGIHPSSRARAIIYLYAILTRKNYHFKVQNSILNERSALVTTNRKSIITTTMIKRNTVRQPAQTRYVEGLGEVTIFQSERLGDGSNWEGYAIDAPKKRFVGRNPDSVFDQLVTDFNSEDVSIEVKPYAIMRGGTIIEVKSFSNSGFAIARTRYDGYPNKMDIVPYTEEIREIARQQGFDPKVPIVINSTPICEEGAPFLVKIGAKQEEV